MQVGGKQANKISTAMFVTLHSTAVATILLSSSHIYTSLFFLSQLIRNLQLRK